MNFEESFNAIAEERIGVESETGRLFTEPPFAHMSDEKWNWFAEFGLFRAPSVGWYRATEEQKESFVQEIRNWMAQSVDGGRENAVFFDTTTIATAATLIHNDDAVRYLAPATLLDLCTFINGVVLYDRVFHLENPKVDSLELNEALGNEPVFIEIPVPETSFDGSGDWDGVDGPAALLRSIWEEAFTYLNVLGASWAKVNYLEEERRKITASWQALIPHVSEDEMFTDRLGQDWPSDGPGLLEKLLAQTERFSLGTYSDVYPSSSAGDFVQECNLRSIFNFMVSYSLQLPYMPTAARLPFNLHLYERAKVVKDRLGTIAWVDRNYREAAKDYTSPDDPNVDLPFFPTVVLNRISSRTEFFEALAEIRENAGPLRAHRAELDDALRKGNSKTINELRAALAQDTKRLPYSKTGASAAIAVIAAVVPQLCALPPLHILITIGLLAGAKEMIPDSESGLRRVFSPTYRALYDMGQVAAEMNNASSAINALWGERSHIQQRNFAEQFDRLRALRYA